MTAESCTLDFRQHLMAHSGQLQLAYIVSSMEVFPTLGVEATGVLLC